MQLKLFVDVKMINLENEIGTAPAPPLLRRHTCPWIILSLPFLKFSDPFSLRGRWLKFTHLLFQGGGGGGDQNYAKATLVKGEGVHAYWEEAEETLAIQTLLKY